MLCRVVSAELHQATVVDKSCENLSEEFLSEDSTEVNIDNVNLRIFNSVPFYPLCNPQLFVNELMDFIESTIEYM